MSLETPAAAIVREQRVAGRMGTYRSCFSLRSRGAFGPDRDASRSGALEAGAARCRWRRPDDQLEPLFPGCHAGYSAALRGSDRCFPLFRRQYRQSLSLHYDFPGVMVRRRSGHFGVIPEGL